MTSTTELLDPESVAILSDIAARRQIVGLSREYADKLRDAHAAYRQTYRALVSAKRAAEGGTRRQAQAVQAWKDSIAEAAIEGLSVDAVYSRLGNAPTATTGFCLNATVTEIVAAYTKLAQERQAALIALVRAEHKKLVSLVEATPDSHAALAILKGLK